MVRQVELKSGVETNVQLSLCNPTLHDMTVALLPFVPEASDALLQKGKAKLCLENISSCKNDLAIGVVRKACMRIMWYAAVLINKGASDSAVE